LLNVTTEPIENCEVLMTVAVDEQQTDKLLKAAARRISKQVKIPGFRPGKVPYRILVQRFGEETIRNEALQDLTESVFKEALGQTKLEPYALASMEDVSWEPLVMKVRVPVEPIVELGDYRAMRLEPEQIEVTDAEVDEALKRLQDEHAVLTPVERPAQLGDLVTMAAKERVGNAVVGDDENVEYELVETGEEDSGPDITTPLIGLSAGDEKEFTVTYPETYANPRFAGKEVSFAVKVHDVKEKEVYPLDDDFAQTVGDFDTLEQLKEKLAANLGEEKQRQADATLAEQALGHLIENAERIEWPKVLEEDSLDQALAEQDQELQRNGLSLDVYLSMQKKSREELREETRPAIQDRLRRSLVVSKLVDLEDLSVAGHEVSGQIDRLSMMAGERSAELRQALATPANLQHIANDILTSKALERLAQIVKGEAKAEDETEPAATETKPAEAEPESDTAETIQAVPSTPAAVEQSQEEDTQ